MYMHMYTSGLDGLSLSLAGVDASVRSVPGMGKAQTSKLRAAEKTAKDPNKPTDEWPSLVSRSTTQPRSYAQNDTVCLTVAAATVKRPSSRQVGARWHLKGRHGADAGGRFVGLTDRHDRQRSTSFRIAPETSVMCSRLPRVNSSFSTPPRDRRGARPRGGPIARAAGATCLRRGVQVRGGAVQGPRAPHPLPSTARRVQPGESRALRV